MHQWIKATNSQGDADAWSNIRVSTRVLDLANWKKHGRHENRSKLSPHLTQVAFDTSRSGPIEMFYDGAIKNRNSSSRTLFRLHIGLKWSIRMVAKS
jgi:hypothetical protein